MDGSVTTLTHLTTMDTTAGPEHFVVADGIRKSEIRGVGPKLAEDLQGHYEAWPNPAHIEFHHAADPVPQELPPELARRAAGRLLPLSWWSLLCRLNDKGRGLRHTLRTGSQLGCLVAMPGQSRVIRCKIDWEAGHDIGGRPTAAGWTWDPGTFFAISRQY